MRFSTFAKLAFVLPALAAPAAAAAQDQSLQEWFEAVPWTFFPNHTEWQTGYDAAFSKDLYATFQHKTYDFEGLKEYWKVVFANVEKLTTSLVIDPTDTVVYPDEDGQGGLVYMTGVETGVSRATGETKSATDAAFGVVKVEDGVRKITEWREVTNYVLG